MSEQSLTPKEKVEKFKLNLVKHLTGVDKEIVDFVFDVIDFSYDAGFLDGQRRIIDKVKEDSK